MNYANATIEIANVRRDPESADKIRVRTGADVEVVIQSNLVDEFPWLETLAAGGQAPRRQYFAMLARSKAQRIRAGG